VAIEDPLRDNPSLRPFWPEIVAEAYPQAVKIVPVVTEWPGADFPSTSPYILDELLDPNFLPD